VDLSVIALLEARRAGLLSRPQWLRNIVAGVVALPLAMAPFIDITGLQTLEEVTRDLHRRKVRVMITGANERVTGKLEKAGLLDLLGRENFCSDLPHALRTLASQTRDTVPTT
jgi:MFS superfamily sulfate permease-like transporter